MEGQTATIKDRHGTGGSRLHRTDDGEFVAYAVWPSREQWEAAGKLPSTSPEAGARMRACIEQSFPTTALEVIDDLLRGFALNYPDPRTLSPTAITSRAAPIGAR